MNFSFVCLLTSLVLAVLAVLPLSSPSRPWVSYFSPLSWLFFVLSLVLAHHGINWNG
jgi:hypothetical protein